MADGNKRVGRRFWARLVAVGGGVYLLVSALGGWILTHPPRPEVAEASRAPLGPGIDVRDVEVSPLAADGPTLAAWYVPARKPDAGAVVFLHGYRGSRTEHAALARALAREAPCALLLPDLRGSGANPSWATTAGPAEAEDALACLEFLSARSIEPERVVLVGASMGAVAAVLCAADARVEAPLAGLLLISPYADLEGAIDRRFRHWVGLGARPWFRPTLWFGELFAGCRLTDVDVVRRSGRARSRNQLVLGLTEDWRAPIEGVERVAAALGARVERVTGVGHHVFSTPRADELHALAVRTLAQWLDPAYGGRVASERE